MSAVIKKKKKEREDVVKVGILEIVGLIDTQFHKKKLVQCVSLENNGACNMIRVKSRAANDIYP